MTQTNLASEWTDSLLLGFETSDDAAVIKLNDDQAAVLTVDILTPLVDDPYTFGRIAAANALSDIYAMGAKPVCALNVLGLSCKLGNETAAAILAGGADAVREAGALTVGGHTTDDTEPKYGLSVFGLVNPDKIVLNGGARAGDILYLTKPLGTGLLSSGYKVGLIDLEQYQPAIDAMSELNSAAGEALVAAEAHAATDVTGFGLAGHLHEMIAASEGVSAVLDWDAIPLLPGAWKLDVDYCRPSRTFSIMEYAEPYIAQGKLNDVDFDNRLAMICDPQTSGGMLVAVAPDKAKIFEDTFLAKAGHPASRIGQMVADDAGLIRFSDAE